MVLKVSGDNLERDANHEQKGFFWMRNSFFVVSGSVDELLIEVFQTKNPDLGFIGDRCN